MSTLLTDLRQGLHSGIAYKAPVRVTTTGPITLSGLQTVDGVSLAANDRVLVKDQASGLENGIYIANTSAWRRAPDWDGSFDARKGTQVRVNEGTLQGVFYLSTSDPIVIGTTATTFLPSAIDVIGPDGEWEIPAPTAAVVALTVNGANGAAVVEAKPNDTEASFLATKSQNATTQGLRVSNPNTGASAASQVVITNETSALSLSHSGTNNSTPNASSVHGTGAGGIVVGATAAADLSLMSNNATQFKVTSAGYFSNSNATQPVASITGGSNTSSLSAVEATYGSGTTLINRGSHMNLSNGRFTAPVTGIYFVRAVCTVTVAVGGQCTANVRVNGTGVGSNMVVRTPFLTSGAFEHTVVGIIAATAGQYISLFHNVDNASNVSNASEFQVALLY